MELWLAGRSLLRETYFQVPTRNTGMHRIIEGPDRNMWFTELKADRVGRAISGLAS